MKIDKEKKKKFVYISLFYKTFLFFRDWCFLLVIREPKEWKKEKKITQCLLKFFYR